MTTEIKATDTLFDELDRLVERSLVKHANNEELRQRFYQIITDVGLSGSGGSFGSAMTIALSQLGFDTLDYTLIECDVPTIKNLKERNSKIAEQAILDDLIEISDEIMAFILDHDIMLVYKGVFVGKVGFGWFVRLTQDFTIGTRSEQLKSIIIDIIHRHHPPVDGYVVKRVSINPKDDTIRVVSERVTPQLKSFDPALAYPDKPTPTDMWDRFTRASGRVILMKGEGGTGKSNYAREMLAHRGWDHVFLVDQESVIVRDDFIDFVRGLKDSAVLLIEDGDRLLGKREDGNSRMSALLNAVSGVATKDIRIIVTVNLKTLNNVDEALLRSGRLFQLLTFEKLSLPDARTFMTSLNVDDADEYLTDERGYTLSDILNWDENHTYQGEHRTTLGFT